MRRVRSRLPGAEAGKHDLSHVIDRFGKAVGEFFERCGDIFQSRFGFVGSRQKESGSRNEDRCRQSEEVLRQIGAATVRQPRGAAQPIPARS